MPETCNAGNERLPVRERMRTWLFWKPFVFTALGGTAGYLYYYFVGCTSGSCAITGTPFGSIAFGSLMGYFPVSRPCAC